MQKNNFIEFKFICKINFNVYLFKAGEIMKNKLKGIFCLLSIFVLSSCSFVNYSDKDMDNMNLIELNQYNKDLIEDNEDVKSDYENLVDISDGKTKEEIIELFNYVNDEVVKSNVMITSESKSFFHTTSVSSGSGTIIKEDSSYYYVLTNNHVIYSLGNRTSYYIYDYLNNEYSNATVLFKNPNYDMALLRFRKGSVSLRVSKLSSSDPSIKENIIVIGQPKGQRNAITFGEVLKYEQVECSNCAKDESNINYDCVYYDAITTNGNSGGMLINYNYELVGVVTFGLNDQNGDYVYGAGSPVSKVKEFLINNDFEVGANND